MSNLAKGLVFVFCIVTFAVKVFAAEQPYEMYYAKQSGEKLTAQVALMDSSKGEKIYKCQTVEAKVSKSGTSIGLHNVKKPKELVK